MPGTLFSQRNIKIKVGHFKPFNSIFNSIALLLLIQLHRMMLSNVSFILSGSLIQPGMKTQLRLEQMPNQKCCLVLYIKVKIKILWKL